MVKDLWRVIWGARLCYALSRCCQQWDRRGQKHCQGAWPSSAPRGDVR
jgi:hypothetical protein